MTITSAARTAEYFPLDEALESARLRSSVAARSRAMQAGRSHGEIATMAIFLTAMLVLLAVGGVYLCACARVTLQGRSLVQLSEQLQSVQAEHDALTKELAQLESAQRIGPKAAAMKMALGGTTHYITSSTSTQIAEAH